MKKTTKQTTTVLATTPLAKGARAKRVSTGRAVRIVVSTPCWSTVKYHNGRTVRVRTASLRNSELYTLA